MLNNRIFKRILFGVTIIAFAVFYAFCQYRYFSSCMGAKLISEKDIPSLGSYEWQDHQHELLFMDNPIAVDVETDTILVSQNPEKIKDYSELIGKFSTVNKVFDVYIVENNNLKNLSDTIKNGKPLTMVVDNKNGTYMKYYVVITNLPVLRLSGELNPDKPTPNERFPYFSGDMTLWASNWPATQEYYVQNSPLDFRRRGDSIKRDKKMSLKIRLMNSKDETTNLDLLGHGHYDDDWILNALSRDDSRMKEKFSIDLWRDLADVTDYAYPMSDCEYVEVVTNGDYQGICLLQTRVDGKYLKVTENDVVLKGKKSEGSPLPQDAAKIFYSNTSEDIVWNVFGDINSLTDVSNVHLENWIDYCLISTYGSMGDNLNMYNCVFVITDIETNPVIHFTPWDTDSSYGISYKTHIPEAYQWGPCYRQEYSAMKELYPNIDELIAKRWFELRETVFTEENVLSIVDDNYNYISCYGAYARDKKYWDNFFKSNTDTPEYLRNYAEKRLVHLDNYYSQYLN